MQIVKKEIEEHPEPPNKKGVPYSLLTDYIENLLILVLLIKNNRCKLIKKYMSNKKPCSVNANLTSVNRLQTANICLTRG